MAGKWISKPEAKAFQIKSACLAWFLSEYILKTHKKSFYVQKQLEEKSFLIKVRKLYDNVERNKSLSFLASNEKIKRQQYKANGTKNGTQVNIESRTLQENVVYQQETSYLRFTRYNISTNEYKPDKKLWMKANNLK